MPFKKGDSKINRQGRPRGSRNDVLTLKIKQELRQLLANDFDKLRSEINALNGKDYVNAYLALMPFVLPKLAPKEPYISVEDASEETIEILKTHVSQFKEPEPTEIVITHKEGMI